MIIDMRVLCSATSNAGIRARHRQGSLLIIVAGISSILAVAGLAFVVRMRSDAVDSLQVEHHAQVRLMLMAGLLYVQEAGRIGWDSDAVDRARVRPDGTLDLANWRRNSDELQSEAYGWVDVRDGFMGPKPVAYSQADIDDMDQRVMNQDGSRWPGLLEAARRINASKGLSASTPLSLTDKQRWLPSPWFPVGTLMRAPMWVTERPAFAIAPIVAPNAIRTPYTFPEATVGHADFGKPYLRHPDPQPALIRVPTGTVVTTAAQAYAQFKSDDPRPRPGSQGRGWFRVYRDGPATFIITVGSGSSLGYRDWSEVDAHGRSQFGDEQALFEEAVANEVRHWYRIEWNAAVSRVGSDPEYQGAFIKQGQAYNAWDHRLVAENRRSAFYAGRTNAAGTIQWIQRLLHAPVIW